MRTPSTHECRCARCDALLAKREPSGLVLRRGDLQATVTGGDFSVSVSCYRCRLPNLVTALRAAPPAPWRSPPPSTATPSSPPTPSPSIAPAALQAT